MASSPGRLKIETANFFVIWRIVSILLGSSYLASQSRMVFTSRVFKRRLSRKTRKSKRKAKKSKGTRKQRGGNVLDGRLSESTDAKYGTMSDTPDFTP